MHRGAGGRAAPTRRTTVPSGAYAQDSNPSSQYGDLPSQFSAPDRDAAGPAPVEDLPQEYYDMLSSGWERSDDGIPW